MNHDQFTLPFLDTTSLGGGFGLYRGFPTSKSRAHTHINSEPEAAEVLDAPVPIEPLIPANDIASPASAVSPRPGRVEPKTTSPPSGS